MDVLLQDLLATKRVEALANLPTLEARFLSLWRNSTVDQFALPPDFRLAPLVPEPGGALLGLLRLEPLLAPQEISLYADGPLGRPTTLMMCQAKLSCQMWWMRRESASQATFAAHFLPDWAAIRQETAELLDRLRVR